MPKLLAAWQNHRLRAGTSNTSNGADATTIRRVPILSEDRLGELGVEL
ncbi:MAG: hypothetical protein V9G10_00125 [Candidatus Nanopelagicales bacterium]